MNPEKRKRREKRKKREKRQADARKVLLAKRPRMPKRRSYSGSFTDDAPDGPLPRDAIHCTTRNLVAPAAKTGLVALWETTEGIILAVGVGRPDAFRIIGSAVVVAPGVAITATHVLEDELQALTNGLQDILMLGACSSGLIIWRATNACKINGTDLTIVSMKLMTGLPETICRAEITTRMPQVDEPINIYGFRASREIFDEPRFSADLRAGVGKVVEVYRTGRDRVMLPSACVQVECHTLGGMSGGPAFDRSGKLVGVLSSSHDTGDDSGPSYVSLLIPCLGQPFEWNWPWGIGMTSLIAQAKDGVVSIDRPGAVGSELAEDGVSTTTYYTEWS